jgi:hypothetical protein
VTVLGQRGSTCSTRGGARRLGAGERAEIVAEGERLLEFLGAGGRAIRNADRRRRD